MANALLIANWQRQGRKGAPRPKLIDPPGGQADNSEHFGGEALPPEEIDRILAARYTTTPEEVTDDGS